MVTRSHVITRINCVPVSELCNKHLFAEHREMPRLVGNLARSLSRKGKPFQLDEIPSQYRLGKGHVMFFYNKFAYLHQRHKELTAELLRRGYQLTQTDSDIFATVPTEWYGQWKPTERDLQLNRQRIADRMPADPKFTLKKVLANNLLDNKMQS